MFTGNPVWNQIRSEESELFPWNPESTYIQEPPYFHALAKRAGKIQDIHGARVLAVLGDSITTDHISPAGNIPSKSPAGQYLISKGVDPIDFNSYGSRRGNDQVMYRCISPISVSITCMVPEIEGGIRCLARRRNHHQLRSGNCVSGAKRPIDRAGGKEYGPVRPRLAQRVRCC